MRYLVFILALPFLASCGDKLTVQKAARNCYTELSGQLVCPPVSPK